MSADTEDKVRDVAVWYFENRNRIPPENVRKRLDFMDKAVKCLLEIIAMQAKDIQELEQRRPRAKLWLPSSVKVDNGPAISLRD